MIIRPHGIIDVISYARLRRKTYWEKHPCYLGKVAFVLKSKPLIGFTSTGFEVSGVIHRPPAFFTHFHWYDGEVKTVGRVPLALVVQRYSHRSIFSTAIPVVANTQIKLQFTRDRSLGWPHSCC